MTENHIVVFEMNGGPPLIVGPFADHDTALGYLNGGNVVDERHNGGWVQTLEPPATDALCAPVELPGRCQCNG